MKILLVDDSFVTLKKATRVIESLGGYQCITAADGKLGLDAIEQNDDLNLIVTDVHMPNMDGLEFIQEIRKREIKTPIIVCTADVQKSTSEKAMELGANLVINKPDLFDSEKAKVVLDKF